MVSKGFIIEHLWAFCAVDEKSGDEGTPVLQSADGTWHPLIAADEERIESFRPIAEEFANQRGQKVILKKFSNFEVIEVIEPMTKKESS